MTQPTSAIADTSRENVQAREALMKTHTPAIGGREMKDSSSVAGVPCPQMDTPAQHSAGAANPYLITGPALISFSGGRTSGYMLHQIIQAHGGALPDDVVVAFANTGKEREETLRFVHEVAWGVRVHWLEWRPLPDRFAVVTYETAARNGEPFAALMAKYGYPPTARGRYCTSKLKIETMKHLMLSLGHKRWDNAVGLRYDEGLRVLRQLARNDTGKERYRAIMPLSTARATKADVMAFWAAQPFDLQLQPHEGNCDLCFLKGKAIIADLLRQAPERADWWIEQERIAVARQEDRRLFNPRRSYAIQRIEALAAEPSSPGLFDEFDVECGLTCEPDQEAA
jgi:3'-phosphoadenosine 5'-phosphosulfate sulfotransferase (PAPS reductase)/FAD synthetase